MPVRPPTLTEFLNGYYPQKVSHPQCHKDFLFVMYSMLGLVMYEVFVTNEVLHMGFLS